MLKSSNHLVFSTLHTNSAVSAVTRLLDMGVPSYLLASSLVGVLGQRLVRRTCSQCINDGYVDVKENECKNCVKSGFSGRLGVFELLEINDDIRQLIHDQASEKRILAASNNDYETMHSYGTRMVSQGLTKASEIARVCEI